LNLHPGVIPVLRKLNANELDIADMIRDGDLTSPQRFHNVSLYNIRITGVGVSYRPTLDEYVYRKPENYLTEEFLRRCNGLSVIMHHPKDSLLTSDEYADRVVGSVFVPYIRDEEVWAVAKIYDDEAIQQLTDNQMSTSPAVLLSKSEKVKLKDGKTLLVEGQPTLLDHIALCHNGVWDKGGEPTGVESETLTRKDSIMAEDAEKDRKEKEENERKDAAARADAEKRADEQFDMLLKGIDSVRAALDAANSRMDALEKERKDADKDEDEDDEGSEEKDKDKDDKNEDDRDSTQAKQLAADAKKRADSAERQNRELQEQLKALQASLSGLESMVRKPFSDEHRGELTSAQARADSVMQQFGEEAPRFMVGETPRTYRQRLAAMLQKYSDKWKDIRLDAITDDSAFKVIEDQVYADAVASARRPRGMKPGTLREITRRSPSGHIITEFAGTDSFVTQFRRPLRRVGRFNLGSH
jgi:hypothetical protein